VNGDMQIAPGLMRPERNRPVAYVQDSTIKLKAKFRAKGFNWQNNGVHVRAKINGTLDLPDTYCVMAADGYLTLPETPLGQPLDPTVKFYSAQGDNSFNIAWEFYTDYIGNDPNWKSAGTTKHTVYVVKAAPVTTMRQESLFNIACKTADGKSGSSTDQQIVDAVFTEFEDREVYKVEPSKGMSQTTPMSYKHDASVPTTGGAEKLIELGKGRCGHWARLFRQALMVHGISDIEVVTLDPDDRSTLQSMEYRFDQAFQIKFGYSSIGRSTLVRGLYVKNWNISDPWNPNTPDSIPAQGNTTPYSAFIDHEMAQFGSLKYDPSYGTKPPTFEAWETDGLSCLVIQYQVDPYLGNPTRSGTWVVTPNLTDSRQTQERIPSNQ
jgi:hypothetical protein